MKQLLIFVVLCLLVLSSCYYDKEELLYGGTANSPCTDTTTNISYSQKVVPMLQQSCYSCHTGNFPSGGIAMGTYATDKAIGLNGKLYGSISHGTGYSPMPQSAPKMTNCQILSIKKWIDAGMPNN